MLLLHAGAVNLAVTYFLFERDLMNNGFVWS